jgi:hypothetical protein
MRLKHVLALAASVPLFSALQATAQLTAPIGVEFLGRDQFLKATTLGQPPCTGVQLHDVAGVVPQQSFNPLDNQYNGNLSLDITFDPAVPNVGTSIPLNDGSGNLTAVTISFACNDSWDDDVN